MNLLCAEQMQFKFATLNQTGWRAADVNARTSDGCTPLELGYRCIAIAGKQAPSMRPATRIEFWLRRALLALLRAGALVSNVRRADLREPLNTLRRL